MNQEWLIKNVLKHLNSVPDKPIDERDYLSLEEAQRIVDDTVEYIGAHGDNTEYNYINGHRKRLAHSLSMIPKAKGKGESCLDVGSYGYMLFWVKKHLGYEDITGIEWHPDIEDKVIHQALTINDETIEFESHNFDISQSDWALDGSHDTILFFEVLEHINQDPMGVMTQIHSRLKMGGTLVMSVPNAISYKAFKEFLVGMPPWTYWFYEPDLSHEPRHCFEYTPIIFKSIIQATGLRENAFKIIYAYTERDHEAATLEIAKSFGIDDESFGETMIINSTKVSQNITLRFPDVLYSPDGYYRHVFPHLHDRLDKAFACFREATDPQETANKSELKKVHAENTKLHGQIAELLQTCEKHLHRHDELQARINEIESERENVSGELSRNQALVLDLEKQKNEMADRINELLYTCECYLRKENEINTAVHESEKVKDTALNEVHDKSEQAENLSKENTHLRNQIEEIETEKLRIEGELGHTQEVALDLQKQKKEMESRINELLFTCDCYMRKEVEHDTAVKEIENARDAALNEARDTRNWAEKLTTEIEELRGKMNKIESEKTRINNQLEQSQDRARELQKQKNDLEVRVNELLFTCDCYMRKEGDNTSEVKEAEKARDKALREANDTRLWAEQLTMENTDLRGQVNELLFACDCYLQQVNDPARCVQVVREKRFRSALETSKSIARKTPILRTALRPVYQSTKKFIKRRM